VIFLVQSRRPIDAGDFEVVIIARVNYVDVRGEAESRDNHIRDLHHANVPKKKNTSTCSDGRPLSEAFESISPKYSKHPATRRVVGNEERTRIKLIFYIV
jgi:hypothetical protein